YDSSSTSVEILPMTRAPATTPVGPLTPHLYEPSAARPVRVKLHRLTTDRRVVPHLHPWGQIALSATGVVRLTVEHGNYLVPPSRAIWVPPGVQHAVTVLDDPTRHDTLEAWARDSGASPRTVARLFRQELGTTFVQWRQQVLLAKALAMAARRVPMSTIAAELGYASPSAFSAMVRRSVGAPPSRFFA